MENKELTQDWYTFEEIAALIDRAYSVLYFHYKNGVLGKPTKRIGRRKFFSKETVAAFLVEYDKNHRINVSEKRYNRWKK